MDKEDIQSDLVTSANFITDITHDLLRKINVPESWINFTNFVIVLLAVIIIAVVIQKIVNYAFTFTFKKAHKVTKLNIFAYAINNRLPHYLGFVFPYSFIRSMIPTVLESYPHIIAPVVKFADICIVFIMIWAIMSVVRSLANVIQEKPAFHNKPLQSYIQVIQIIFYIFGAVAIFSILTGKSATTFFAAMGAASAVLMLMFKDTIMGFVSSIQISTNEMVMLGDWITMNKYGADGSVEEINLTTVKVRNFDKTITTIPTYALISDSFQNWRGMQDSGGRRIKRAIYIKQSEIKVLSDDELQKYAQMPALTSYIKEKQKLYSERNTSLGIKADAPIKGYQITNCDLFLNYGIWYLRNNPEIRQDMTLLVRQLAPSTEGMPIEIYTFTDTTVWAEYERIMSEVFNHMITSVHAFGLTIYESPAGTDTSNIFITNKNN